MAPCGCLATSRLLLVLLALGSCACGDALVGSGYQGEPLMVLSGQVIIEEALADPLGEARVAVHWSSQGEFGYQHQQETEVVTSFPAQYTLALYTPPPGEVHYQPRHANHPMAMGVPIVYDDLDGDGAFDEGEGVIGGAQDVMVLYVVEADEIGPPHDGEGGEPGPSDDTDDPGPGPEPQLFEEGYHAVRTLGDACEGDFLEIEPVDPGDVELTMGELWEHLNDMDCNGDLEEWGER